MISHLINANWCIEESWELLYLYDYYEINMSYFEAFVSRHIDSIFESMKANVVNSVYGVAYRDFDVHIILGQLHRIALEIKEAGWTIERNRKLDRKKGTWHAVPLNVVH
jgi:hypothetical protein